MGVHFDRGHALFVLKRFEEAIREYQLELGVEPQCVASQTNIAAAQLNMGQFAEARQTVRQALEIRPEYPHAYYLLSFLEPNLAGDSAAQRAIEEAIRFDPSAIHWCRLGKVVLQQGRHGDAIVAFDRALAADACHVESLALKANSLHQLHRTQEALRILKSARSLAPENALVHRFLGSISLDAGEPWAALHAYEESQRINPLQAEMPEKIATAYGTQIWPLNSLNRVRSRYLSLSNPRRWVVQTVLATLFLFVLVVAPRSSPYWSTSAAIVLLAITNSFFVIVATPVYAQTLGEFRTRNANRRSWCFAAANAGTLLVGLGVLHILLSVAVVIFIFFPQFAFFAISITLGIGAFGAVHMTSRRWAIFTIPASILSYMLLAGYGAACFYESPGIAVACWIAILILSGLGNLVLRRLEVRQLPAHTASP